MTLQPEQRYSQILEVVSGVRIPLELARNQVLRQTLESRDSKSIATELLRLSQKNIERVRIQAILNVWIQLLETDWFNFQFTDQTTPHSSVDLT